MKKKTNLRKKKFKLNKVSFGAKTVQFKIRLSKRPDKKITMSKNNKKENKYIINYTLRVLKLYCTLPSITKLVLECARKKLRPKCVTSEPSLVLFNRESLI